jgi:hypothetical protein
VVSCFLLHPTAPCSEPWHCMVEPGVLWMRMAILCSLYPFPEGVTYVGGNKVGFSTLCYPRMTHTIPKVEVNHGTPKRKATRPRVHHLLNRSR